MMTSNEPSAQEIDDRARKRTAIGLAAIRPTAKTALLRPPRAGDPFGCLWAMVLPVVAIILVTVLLVAARVLDAPFTWPQAQAWAAGWLGGVAPIAVVADRVVVVDDFTQNATALQSSEQSGGWAVQVRPDEGVFHLIIQPAHLAWSTIGADALQPYFAEAAFTVSASTPSGVCGLLARRQNAESFYLFAVNGKGEFQVQLLQDGKLASLTPWLADIAINPAGVANRLAVEDNGDMLRFFVNSFLFYETDEAKLPPGDVGLFGAAPTDEGAEIDVDWLRVYALPAS